jgi:hypothetical protein
VLMIQTSQSARKRVTTEHRAGEPTPGKANA